MALGHLRDDVVAPLHRGDDPTWGWSSHVSFLLQFIYPCHNLFSVFSDKNNVLTSAWMDDADQSRTAWLLGDIWTLPSAADEEWNSPNRPYRTVANLQPFVNLYAEVSTFS